MLKVEGVGEDKEWSLKSSYKVVSRQAFIRIHLYATIHHPMASRLRESSTYLNLFGVTPNK